MLKRSLWILIAASLVAPSARAGDTIDEVRPAAPDGRVSIENLNGSVTVRGWDRDEVRVEGELGDGARDLIVTGTERRVRVEVEVSGRWNRGSHGTDLSIHVPEGSEVWIEGVNLAVDVDGVRGAISVETVNGPVTLVGNPASIEVETVNGTVEFTGSCREVQIETTSGSIDLDGVEGEVMAETVSGTAVIFGGLFTELEFSSVSGGLQFRGELHPEGSFEFETHSGTLDLLFPADVSADFELETFSGKIRNEFGPEPRRTSRYAPGKELAFSTGGGGAEVNIASFSGEIRIRRR